MSKNFDSTDSTSVSEPQGNLFGVRDAGLNASYIAAFTAVASGILAMAKSEFSVGGALGTAIGAVAASCVVDKSANFHTAMEVGGGFGMGGAAVGSIVQQRLFPASEEAKAPEAVTGFTAQKLFSPNSGIGVIEESIGFIPGL